MKKNWTGLRTLLMGTAAAIVLIAATACTNPVSDVLGSKSWGLVGTWIDADPMHTLSYPPQCYKLVVKSDGTFTSTDPGGFTGTSGTYTISSVSVSGNARTYTIDFSWQSAGTFHSYTLARITDSNQSEANSNNGSGSLPYPTAINPADSMSYSKRTLQ